jgi:putative ABC transport system permease protein
MWKLTIRGLWAHKLRFTLTGLAVVLGVAFMAGTMILTDTMRQTFDGLFATNNAGIDVVVQRSAAIDGEMGAARERVPADTLASVADVPGVRAAAGTIQGFAQLVDHDGEANTTDGFGGTIGMNWVDDARLNPFDLADGRAPNGPDEVVIDLATSEQQGYGIGDTVTVLTQGAPRELTVVGTATYGDVDGLPGVTALATDDATAMELFAEPGAYDAVVVSGDGSLDDAELATAVETALTPTGDFEVLTGEADTTAKQDQFQEDLSFFNTFLLTFAYISLFVGSFIIYNTFSIVVAQRSRDMAMLRAIGAGRRQVLRSVLVESVAVGLLASALGLAAGVVLSYGLRGLLGAVGVEIPGGSVVISSGTVVASAVVGLTVTVLSAFGPALRASRIAPIAALRDVAQDRTASSLRRTVIGLVVTAFGVVTFAAGVVSHSSDGLALLGLGALVTIIGLFVLGPVIARPAVHVLAWPAPVLDGTTGRLARENAKRNPKRTAATASALMIGVALVGLITILAASTKDSVSAAVDRSLRADYIVDSGAWGEGGFSPELATALADRPDVGTVVPMRAAPAEIGGSSGQITGFDTGALDQVLDLDVSAGALTDVHDDGIAVLDGTEVRGREVGLGDTVRVRFARTGIQRLTVRAVFDEAVPGRDAPWIVGLDTFEANVTDQFDQQLYVADAPREALDEVLADWPNADLQDQAAVKAELTGEIDQMLNLIYGLLGLAVVIALIGIANTLALSVHERRREVGLLRAIGMGRSQVRRAVRWEAVAIALLGTALGTTLAVAGAWGIVQALDGEVTAFTVPPVQLGVIVVLAALAGVGAALGPARRAARLDVLDAIASA